MPAYCCMKQLLSSGDGASTACVQVVCLSVYPLLSISHTFHANRKNPGRMYHQMLSMLTVCLWWHKKIFNSSMLSVFTLFICKYSSKDDFPNIFPLPRVYEMVSVTVLYSHVCVHQGILHSAGLRTCMPKAWAQPGQPGASPDASALTAAHDGDQPEGNEAPELNCLRISQQETMTA